MPTNSFNVTLQEGSRVIGPVNIPTGLTSVKIEIDRDNWTDPAIKLTLKIDISLDNGATWNNPPADCVPFPVGLEAEGGVVLDKNGQLVHTSVVAGPLPQPSNPDRKARANITVTGGSIPTTVTITTA